MGLVSGPELGVVCPCCLSLVWKAYTRAHKHSQLPAAEPASAVAVQFIHMLQRRVGEDAMKKAMERIIIGATAKLAQGTPPGAKPWQDGVPGSKFDSDV